MKKISFRRYMEIQIRFLLLMQYKTGLSYQALASVYAVQLSNKLHNKYEVI